MQTSMSYKNHSFWEILMVYLLHRRDNGYISANRERGDGWVFHVVNQAHSDTIRSYIIGLYIGTHAHSDMRSIYRTSTQAEAVYGCMNSIEAPVFSLLVILANKKKCKRQINVKNQFPCHMSRVKDLRRKINLCRLLRLMVTKSNERLWRGQ